MKYLNKPSNRPMMSGVPFVMHGAGGRMRLFAGLTINVTGAALLLQDGLRFLSL